MSKYKVGDEVLVKGKIMQIDHVDHIVPYGIETKNDAAWVEETEIVGAEAKSDIISTIPQSEVDAYNQGHADGMAQGLNDGRNEVWEFIRKYSFFPSKEDWEEFMEFANIESASNFFSDYTYEEALAKLKSYEDSKIEVGDVVKSTLYADMNYGVVVSIEDNKANLVHEDGTFSALMPLEFMVKTGKHIDISSILEQIGE